MGAADRAAQSGSESGAAGIAAVQRARSSSLRDEGAPLRNALVLVALAVCSAVGFTQDATSVLREVDQALGASSLKSIRYSGTGFAYNFLQNWRPDGAYPRFYAQHLIEKIETWTPQPTLGDMSIETTFSDYCDFNGVKFPARIVQKQWIYPVLELNVASVEPNAAVNLQAPAGGAQAARVESTKVADGVWYLAGTPDPNSQLVEFKDFLVIVESSVTEGRALANIAEAHRLVPGKPITYHVNSHHHSDHSAGLRAFVAEGSTIITHEMNRKFYEDVVLKAPHTLDPDALTKT